jgi:class 3 adenylate cyclase
MDLSNKLFVCTDEMLQKFIVQLDSNGLIAFIDRYLDENALKDILANFSLRAADLLLADRQAVRDGLTKYEEILDEVIKSNPNMINKGCILFTDLVNSTAKINLLGDSDFYEQVLIKHNSILQECINSNGGRIIKNIGDAYLAIFRNKFDALKCCITAQEKFRNLNKGKNSENQIIIRMALHFGEFHKKIMENNNIDVYGSSVNYAARMVANTGGGQICVSKDFIENWKAEIEKIDNSMEEWKKRIEDYDPENWHYYKINDFKKDYESKLSDKNLYNTIEFSSIGWFSFKGFEKEQELYCVIIKNQ